VCEFLVKPQAVAVGRVNDDGDVEPFQVFFDEGPYVGSVDPTHTCRETRQGEAGGEHFFRDQPGKRLQRMIDIVQAGLAGHCTRPSEGSCISKLMMRALQPSVSAPPLTHAAPGFGWLCWQ